MKKVLFFVVMTMLTVALSAQSTTSSIVGHVADANGNPVADALVTAVYTPTGSVYHVTSDARGLFRINGVVAGGPYDVKADDFGHKPAIRQNVFAPLGSRAEVDLVFKDNVIQLDEVAIEAESDYSNMNVQRSGVGTRIDSKAMEGVPTINRSLNDLVKLVPQAISNNTYFSLGGGNERGSAVTVDGANFNNAFGIGTSLPAGGNPISLEAVEEVSVSLTPFDVRHSGFNGGTVNVVTKQGTNQWHASVYDYMTGSNAQGHFIADEVAARNSTLNNVAGVTFSGPLVKDKLFLFVNAEYTADREAGSTVSARPNDSYEFGGSTGLVRPTVAQMETIKQFLSDQFGYDPGRYQNYNISTPDYKLLARLDWHINDMHKFHIRFSHTHESEAKGASSSMSPLGSTNTRFCASDGNTYSFNRYDAGRQSIYALPFESTRYTQDANLTTVAAELNSWFFDGKANNMLRATWSYQNDPRSYVGGLFPTVDILEPYIDANNQKQYAMFTTFGPDPFTYENLRRVNTINVTDEFSYFLGAHNLMLGIQYEHNRITNGFMQGGAGWYIYESWNAFQNDVLNPSASTGPNAFMITHANDNDPTRTMNPAFDRNQVSFYVQDEMDLSRYFKLSVGLRAEVPIYSFVYDNHNTDFDQVVANNPGTSFAGLTTDGLPKTHFNISPRVAFNWDVLHNRKMVLRGGTGLFTGMMPSVWIVSTAGNSNCLQYQYINNNASAYGTVPVNFHSNRVDIINQLYSGTPFVQQALSAPTAGTFFDSDFRMPSSWKSSLSLDGDLPFGIHAMLEGIFSYNFNEICAYTLGYRQNGTVQLPGEPEGRTNYVSEGVKNSANAEVHGYKLTNARDLHGYYASITGQLTKDFDWGLNLMAAYTYSAGRSVNDGYGDQVYELSSAAYNVNGSNNPELGYSASVTPHHLIASIGYTFERPNATTKVALFYEGLNLGIVQSNFYSRTSYLIKTNESGIIGGTALLFVPTKEELATMPFVSDANRESFDHFVENDSYLSSHRGEYSLRNCANAPWVGRLNLRITHEFFFNIAGHRHAVELGVDLNNFANLFNSEWGLYKELSSPQVLEYKNGKYTFTNPEWNNYNSLRSTWQLLGHIKYSF